jgi:hypothetical protein
MKKLLLFFCLGMSSCWAAQFDLHQAQDQDLRRVWFSIKTRADLDAFSERRPGIILGFWVNEQQGNHQTLLHMIVEKPGQPSADDLFLFEILKNNGARTDIVGLRGRTVDELLTPDNVPKFEFGYILQGDWSAQDCLDSRPVEQNPQMEEQLNIEDELIVTITGIWDEVLNGQQDILAFFSWLEAQNYQSIFNYQGFPRAQGDTFLHSLISTERPERYLLLFEKLVSLGARLDIENDAGVTVEQLIELPANSEFKEVVRRLRRAVPLPEQPVIELPGREPLVPPVGGPEAPIDNNSAPRAVPAPVQASVVGEENKKPHWFAGNTRWAVIGGMLGLCYFVYTYTTKKPKTKEKGRLN